MASSEPEEWDGGSLGLSQLGAPVLVCDGQGLVVGLSPQAGALLDRLEVTVTEPPFALPRSLLNALAEVSEGEAIEWRPDSGQVDACLGCTRYPLGRAHAIILMREVSAKHAELCRRLHQQRLESTGRLVASIAHDVRTSVASILYNADFLVNAMPSLPVEEVSETASEIHQASQRLQAMVEGLLDFAKLGPPISGKVSLREVFRRASALVRPAYREGKHDLAAEIPAQAEWVLGNGLVIDQIFVNLLVNAAEAARTAIQVSIFAERVPSVGTEPPVVKVHFRDTGPGIPAALRRTVFQPFFTTRAHGTGIGLTTAREAARDLGGDVVLEESEAGAHFVLTLPAAGLAPGR